MFMVEGIIKRNLYGISKVSFYWSHQYQQIDRPCTFIMSCSSNAKLAERLKEAADSQCLFEDPRLTADVNGRTFISARCLVMGKTADRDLKKLGF